MVFLLVFGRRVVAVIDRRTVSWVDAWAKTVVIVVTLIVSIVIVPAKVLELGAVQDMSRAAQDLITVGLWSGALVGRPARLVVRPPRATNLMERV